MRRWIGEAPIREADPLPEGVAASELVPRSCKSAGTDHFNIVIGIAQEFKSVVLSPSTALTVRVCEPLVSVVVSSPYENVALGQDGRPAWGAQTSEARCP